MLSLSLDKQIYSLEAVQKAAYRFIDRLSILIRQEDDRIVCDIESVPGKKTELENVVNDFKRELLDQELRLKIKTETEGARNLVLAYAFSRTGLQE